MFLEKYTGQNIPDERTLRKNYIRDIYLEKLSSFRDEIQDGPIWVSIDETTDVERRYIWNVVIGKLCDEPTNSILLNCEKFEKSNHQTIEKLFNDSMSLLWPSGVKHENVLLFVSDAAPYMVKAGKALNIFLSKTNTSYMFSAWFSSCGRDNQKKILYRRFSHS